jgi:hypothetical protein
LTAQDLEDAFVKAKALSRLEKQLVDEYEARVEEAADMQQEYRRVLVLAHVQAGADPELKTAALREARAKELASGAEHAAAVADGMVKATLARLRAVEMDQEMLNALISLSVRRLVPIDVYR